MDPRAPLSTPAALKEFGKSLLHETTFWNLGILTFTSAGNPVMFAANCAKSATALALSYKQTRDGGATKSKISPYVIEGIFGLANAASAYLEYKGIISSHARPEESAMRAGTFFCEGLFASAAYFHDTVLKKKVETSGFFGRVLRNPNLYLGPRIILKGFFALKPVAKALGTIPGTDMGVLKAAVAVVGGGVSALALAKPQKGFVGALQKNLGVVGQVGLNLVAIPVIMQNQNSSPQFLAALCLSTAGWATYYARNKWFKKETPAAPTAA